MGEKTRNTRQRAVILDCLRANSAVHLTADEIYDKLVGQGSRVGRATVYRALSAMSADGTIREYQLRGDSPACFQYVGKESLCHRHYHVLCVECGELVHFASEMLDEALLAAEKENNFRIDERRTVFYGSCSKCIGKEER